MFTLINHFALLDSLFPNLDLPSAPALHPLLEDQEGLRYQPIQVLPVIVTVSV